MKTIETSLFKVSSVELLNRNSKFLFDFSIDYPQPETLLEEAILTISGWILGKEKTINAVEVSDENGRVLSKLPVDQSRPDVARFHCTHSKAGTSGFKGLIQINDRKNQAFTLHLTAISDEGSTILIGTIQLQLKKTHLPKYSNHNSAPRSLTTETQAFSGKFIEDLSSDADWKSVRLAVSNRYIRGQGIEIGALNSPLPIPTSAKVKYVDRMSLRELRNQYPELLTLPLVEVDIVDDGEKLSSIQDETQDFVIANHFLEHCQNPIYAIENALRVLKPGGVLYLAIPDKRFTFDIDRPLTTTQHLVKDYQDGPNWSRKQHFEEWVHLVDRTQGQDEVTKRIEHLMNIDYSIHYHVWNSESLLEFITILRSVLNAQFDVDFFIQNGMEIICILEKSD